MPKKMTPKSQAKFLSFTFLSFNRIMRLHSNVYNYAICLKLL